MDSIDWDLRVFLFELPNFEKLLFYIAQSMDPKLDIAKKLVQQLMNK
jgi:hypothetical protein